MYENYEELFTTHKDNYKKYENIKSDLIYGNINQIKNPFITIAIPTYRRADLLKLAIISAVNQSNGTCEYEIVIVDNEPSKSETETEKAVKSFKNEKILYYRNKENIGMFGNWNRCIELARGEWIAFLHDDDMLETKYLNKVIKFLKRKRDIGAIGANFEILNNAQGSNINSFNNKSYFKTFIQKLEENKLMRLSRIDSLIMNGNIFGAPTCGTIFRKKYLVDLGGFDEDYFPSADWFLTLKFSENYKFYKTRSLFGYYRVFENESLNPETLKKFILQAEKIREYMSVKTKLGKMLNTLFADELYFSTLSWMKNLGKDSGIDFEALNKEYGYSYKPIRYHIYNKIKTLYWFCKKIITIVIG